MKFPLVLSVVLMGLAISASVTAAAEEPIDLGAVTEEHVMIPMRDGGSIIDLFVHPFRRRPVARSVRTTLCRLAANEHTSHDGPNGIGRVCGRIRKLSWYASV